jgi:hypothetical protein
LCSRDIHIAPRGFCCSGVWQLREHAARGKPIQRAIGFVHFPERSEKKQGRRSKSAQEKRSR